MVDLLFIITLKFLCRLNAPKISDNHAQVTWWNVALLFWFMLCNDFDNEIPVRKKRRQKKKAFYDWATTGIPVKRRRWLRSVSYDELSLWDPLSLLLFVISGTTGYPSGLEIINASFCGECLSFNLFSILFQRYSARKGCSGIISECY